jgi:hypothetical protein
VGEEVTSWKEMGGRFGKASTYDSKDFNFLKSVWGVEARSHGFKENTDVHGIKLQYRKPQKMTN